MTSKRFIPNVALAIAAVFLLPGYSSCDPIIPNNGFDLWCDDTLCDWDVEKGEIAKVSTWHERDYGVEMIGDAAISTLSDVASTDGVDCLRFDLLADIEPSAEVTLQMDIYDDGIVDWERPIPASEWANLHYLVHMPDNYQGLRFRISKTGSGRAVLAQIAAEDAVGCDGPTLAIDDQPDGAYCSDSEMCASGLCATQVSSFALGDVCGECMTDDDCTPGDVCGAQAPDGEPFLDLYRACGAPARHALGERCVGDGECESGICHETVCSTCRTNADCDAGAGTCFVRDRTDELTYWLAPHQCAPNGALAETGTACLIDGDCASGACEGGDALSVCQLDGRVCAADTDCPDDLQCVTIGITGGACQ